MLKKGTTGGGYRDDRSLYHLSNESRALLPSFLQLAGVETMMVLLLPFRLLLLTSVSRLICGFPDLVIWSILRLKEAMKRI